MATTRQIVERYFAAIRASYPEASASFAATAGTLEQVAPGMACAIALYAAHDGQVVADGLPPNVYDGYRWMTLAEIAETREELDGMAKVGEWDDAKTKVVDWWVPGWVPLLTDGNANHLCIDSVGTFTGKVGQLISFVHDAADREIVAPSFDAWFEAWTESLEGGTWAIGDGIASLTPSAATTRLFAERLVGYPIAHEAQRVKKAVENKPRSKKPTPEDTALLAVFAQRMTRDEITAAIAAGAKLDARDASGRTPLHLVMKCSNEVPAQTLIAAGADVNATDHEGVTPLHLAVLAHARIAPTLIRLLAEAGADLARGDRHGRSPIFDVQSAEALQTLLDLGVDASALGPDGKSLQQHLRQRGAAQRLVDLATR